MCERSCPLMCLFQVWPQWYELYVWTGEVYIIPVPWSYALEWDVCSQGAGHTWSGPARPRFVRPFKCLYFEGGISLTWRRKRSVTSILLVLCFIYSRKLTREHELKQKLSDVICMVMWRNGNCDLHYSNFRVSSSTRQNLNLFIPKCCKRIVFVGLLTRVFFFLFFFCAWFAISSKWRKSILIRVLKWHVMDGLFARCYERVIFVNSDELLRVLAKPQLYMFDFHAVWDNGKILFPLKSWKIRFFSFYSFRFWSLFFSLDKTKKHWSNKSCLPPMNGDMYKLKVQKAIFMEVFSCVYFRRPGCFCVRYMQTGKDKLWSEMTCFSSIGRHVL